MRGASLLAVCALVVGATPAGASPLAVKQEPWHQRAFTGGQLEGCSSYQGMDSCRGQQTDYPEATVAGRRWQTPPPGHVLNAGGSEWQHYHALQGYARVDYASDRQSAVVHVVTFVKEAPSSSSPRLRYRFGGESATWTESAEFTVSAADYEQRVHAVGEHVAAMEGLAVDVWAPDVYNATLRLDPVCWCAPVSIIRR